MPKKESQWKVLGFVSEYDKYCGWAQGVLVEGEDGTVIHIEVSAEYRGDTPYVEAFASDPKVKKTTISRISKEFRLNTSDFQHQFKSSKKMKHHHDKRPEHCIVDETESKLWGRTKD